MTRTPSSVLRALCVVALAAPGLASAQAVNSAANVTGSASAASLAGAASRATAMPATVVPSLAPALGFQNAPSISAAPAAALAAPAATTPSAVLPAAAPALRARRAAADGPTPLQEPLQPGQYWSPHADGRRDGRMGTGDEMVHDGPRGRELVSIREFEQPAEPVGWRSSRSQSARLFDGTSARRDLADAAPVAAAASTNASAPLAKTASAAAPAPVSVPSASAAKSSRGLPLALKILVGVALALVPTLAFAAPAAAAAGIGTLSVGGTLEIMAAVRPAASAIGAVAGAIYGMIAARPKDGSEASSGEMLSSVLRYGALGGASVYMLLDVTQLAFLGPTGGGLQPLSSAVVTAALGRTAFQGKFMDPATSSADRIVGAFPAVAAALGISLGVALFVAPPISITLALAAMTVTGVATALFTALFKLGRSPLDGPAKMAKGFVLQALMTGMALAVSNPYLFWIFTAMGAAGFGLVLWAMARELISFLPGHATPAPAPAPAPTTPPTTTPPIPKV